MRICITMCICMRIVILFAYYGLMILNRSGRGAVFVHIDRKRKTERRQTYENRNARSLIEGVILALLIVLCIAIPSISAYLTTSESKDSAFTIAKQESFTLNPDDGSTPVDGETYDYGDYTYTYSESDGGWAVALNLDVTDEYQTSYGPILESINRKPITNMRKTFSYCYSLITAPVIPASVTNMQGTFSYCESLTTAPVIPEGVTCITDIFECCGSLKTYVGSTDPDGDFSNYKIPNNVPDMDFAFYWCSELDLAP